MERVYFQQEQMLDELKDLIDKGLFTEQEIKVIMKKRTAFETALVRRIAKKSDFVRYAAYEMGLEQLRRKRRERLRECQACLVWGVLTTPSPTYVYQNIFHAHFFPS